MTVPLCQGAPQGSQKQRPSKDVTPDTPQVSAPNSPATSLRPGLRERREKPPAGCPQPEGGHPRGGTGDPGKPGPSPKSSCGDRKGDVQKTPRDHTPPLGMPGTAPNGCCRPWRGAGAGRGPQGEQALGGYSTARVAGEKKKAKRSLPLDRTKAEWPGQRAGSPSWTRDVG